MGIFGVHMPPIYGEGKKEAFERLIREIETRNSQQESRLQKAFYDENWCVEQISKFNHR
jgi:hypothetical protein